ncbi:MAG: ABC transporter ATP-binding protein/permease [Egibacteraceae bacterium]
MMIHRRLLAIAGPIWRQVALTVGVSLAMSATLLGQAFLVGLILARLFGGQGFAAVRAPLVGVVTLVVVRAGLAWLREVCVQLTAAAVKDRIRARLLAKLVDLGPGYLIRTRTGEVQSTTVDGVEGLEHYYGRYLPQLVNCLVTAGFVVAFLFTRDVVVAAVALGVTVFIPTVPRLVDKTVGRRGKEHWQAYLDYNADFVDTLQGMTTLKAFNATGGHRQALRDRAVRLYQMTMRHMAAALVDSGLTALGQGAGAALAVAVGAVRVAGGALDVPSLFLVLVLASEGFRPFRELTGYWHAGYMGVAASSAIAEIDAALPEVADRPDARAFDRATHQPAVAFEDVTFSYETRDRPAVDSVSFRAAPGETVAIVGRSGAGKTTIVALLLRFFDPQQGRITIGGIDVRDLRLDSLRAQIAVVAQDTYLFYGTIADNLRLAKPDATDEELVAAAKAANVHAFVAALPGGYATRVGERGLTLSGGQRQRIAIARALLKDAPILVLDEATSSVDAENERVITEALDRLAAGRTTLVIAHRLSTVRRADRIVVLSAGRVAEVGAHDDLVDRRGDYARLVAAQGDTR